MVIALAASALYAWPSSYQPLGCFGASVVTSRSSFTASDVPIGAAVSLGEHPAVLDVRRPSGNDTLQRSDSLRILSERQIRRAEERVRCHQARIQLNRVLERSHGLIGMTSLRERRTERHEDRRIIGGRAQKLAIDAGRIVEPGLFHRLRGGPLELGIRVRGLGCRRCRDRQREQERQRGFASIHLVPAARTAANSHTEGLAFILTLRSRFENWRLPRRAARRWRPASRWYRGVRSADSISSDQ